MQELTSFLNLPSYNYLFLCGLCELERPKGAGESIECSVLDVCFYICSVRDYLLHLFAFVFVFPHSTFDVGRSMFDVHLYYALTP